MSFPFLQILLKVKGDIFFFQAEDGIRDRDVTGVQTCALPICEQGLLLFIAVRSLLTAVASHCRAQALGTWASVVAAHGLSSCSTWA